MVDNVQTASIGGLAPVDEPVAFHPRRTTFVAPLDDTAREPSARRGQQEPHPVNQTLAPASSDESVDVPTEAPTDPPADSVVDAPTPSSPRGPRPVSTPSHRADVDLDEVVPTDAFEARPASIARHSIDTSAITLPVLAVSVPDDLPQPPERLTLDDEVLARLVEKRLDDTATIDLMAVVQAQLALREVEAARFASWEHEITRVGTDEAAQALEATRLRFTGVVPVVSPGTLRPARPVLEAGHAPTNAAAAGATAVRASSVAVAAPAADPVAAAVPALDADVPPAEARVDRDAVADQEALAETSRPASVGGPVATAPVPSLLTRPMTLVVAATAALVVVAAVVLAFVPGLALASAVLATIAVPVATGLVGLAALASVSTRPDDADRVARRGPIGVVAGVVLGTVVGLGLLLSDQAAFAWQGYLVRAVDLAGLSTSVSVVVALLGAAVVAFIAAVMITGFRSTARD